MLLSYVSFISNATDVRKIIVSELTMWINSTIKGTDITVKYNVKYNVIIDTSAFSISLGYDT